MSTVAQELVTLVVGRLNFPRACPVSQTQENQQVPAVKAGVEVAGS